MNHKRLSGESRGHAAVLRKGRIFPRQRKYTGRLKKGWSAGWQEHGLKITRLVLTLVVKPVDSVNAGTLVVAAQQEEVLRVLDLVGEQQADGLQRLLAPVHVVPQEQVVALGREATVLEQPQQVVVLTVDITCNTSNMLWTRAQTTSSSRDSRFGRELSTSSSAAQGTRYLTKGHSRPQKDCVEAFTRSAPIAFAPPRMNLSTVIRTQGAEDTQRHRTFYHHPKKQRKHGRGQTEMMETRGDSLSTRMTKISQWTAPKWRTPLELKKIESFRRHQRGNMLWPGRGFRFLGANWDRCHLFDIQTPNYTMHKAIKTGAWCTLLCWSTYLLIINTLFSIGTTRQADNQGVTDSNLCSRDKRNFRPCTCRGHR